MTEINFLEKRNFEAKENTLNLFQETISVLDKKIKEEKDSYKIRVYENQKLRLIELKDKYENLENAWITKKTQSKLYILSKELQVKAKKWEILWKDINEAFSYLTSEKKERMDNLVDRSVRDFVEKNIKFSSHKLIKIKETWFEKAFYDKFTINYLNYFYEAWFSTDKKDIFNEKWLVISKDNLELLLAKTLNDLNENWYDINSNLKEKLTFKLSTWEVVEKDLKNIFSDKISDLDNLYFKEIDSYILRFWDKLDFNKIQQIFDKIENYEKFRIKYWNYYEELGENKLNFLILKINLRLNNLIKKKLNEIREFLKNIKDLKKEKSNIEIYKTEFQNLKNFIDKSIQKYSYEKIQKYLWDPTLILYEKDLEEIEKSFKAVYFIKELDEINELMEKLWNDLKNVKENILNKISFLETKIQILISSNIIDKEFWENIIKDLRNNLYTKLLNYYLEKAKISKITWRQDIWSLEFFKVLIEAKKALEISIEEIDIIIKLWSEQAFLKEFELPYIKARVENLKKDIDWKTTIDSWKDIFLNELWEIIWNEKSKELFLLSYLESIFDPESVSPYWAVWYFQLLPWVAKDFWMKNTNDLKDPIKSAKIAAKYLKYLLWESNWDLREALLKYNWWFTNRLLDKNVENAKNNIIEISNRLLYCKSIIKNEKVSVEELITRITNIHTKYFDPKTIRDWKYHFRILDDNDKKRVSKDDIEKWIDKYIMDTLKQQYFYPEQFEAVKKAYEKSTN